MEQINFQMSDKNIPISESLQEFRIQTVKSVTKFATNVRWTVKAALNPRKFGKKKETFGFKSVKVCSQVPELKEFEKGLFELTKNIKHRDPKSQNKSDFQIWSHPWADKTYALILRLKSLLQAACSRSTTSKWSCSDFKSVGVESVNIVKTHLLWYSVWHTKKKQNSWGLITQLKKGQKKEKKE